MSIRSGHSFRIVYRSTDNDCYSFPVDNIEIAADESAVGAMAVWHLGQERVTSPDRYEFQVSLNFATSSQSTFSTELLLYHVFLFLKTELCIID